MTLNGGNFSTSTASGTPNVITFANGASLVKLKNGGFNLGNGSYVLGTSGSDTINVVYGPSG
jgi:hypothetical protein